jgi:hypothetical protein
MSDEPEDISIAAGLVSAIGTRQEWARAFDDHLDYLDRLISGLKALDAPTCRATGAADEPSPRGKARASRGEFDSDDRLREWRRADRATWAEYRKWEDQRFPINPAAPFRDPPRMTAARRASEKEQEIEKAKAILRLREVPRVGR